MLLILDSMAEVYREIGVETSTERLIDALAEHAPDVGEPVREEHRTREGVRRFRPHVEWKDGQ